MPYEQLPLTLVDGLGTVLVFGGAIWVAWHLVGPGSREDALVKARRTLRAYSVIVLGGIAGTTAKILDGTSPLASQITSVITTVSGIGVLVWLTALLIQRTREEQAIIEEQAARARSARDLPRLLKRLKS